MPCGRRDRDTQGGRGLMDRNGQLESGVDDGLTR